MTPSTTSAGQASTALVTARFLRMLSIVLEQLEAVRDADGRAEFAGLTARAGVLECETDALERELEDACLQAFATGLSDEELAFHLMVFRSLTNLERVGDYAFNVARALETFAPRVRSATLQDAVPIVRLLSQMIERLSFAFAERDVQAAREVMRLDFEQVDALYEQMQRASLTRLLERPEDTEVALTAGRMARDLERLGDHLVNVAERLEVLVLRPGGAR
ncbi:phosphate signaling complex PhoU family protein [Deinococcus koreensis]|uniref:PhoU family transcriptional regulator n=1 Tax=Deinococcus koreensis TaxID=2054903 RepID=A0A2K3UU47_9DEIO|nr:phosphate uptake regulator PhoU [Deinococcus koreensis]PNY80062.1 PhoU family transcriptional regulator [Deinococcus koreensis]